MYGKLLCMFYIKFTFLLPLTFPCLSLSLPLRTIYSQSELSEQNKATSVGDESLFAMLDEEELSGGSDHDELTASRSSDALLLGRKSDEDLILEMEEFI